jgi:hypothetical protein
VLDEARTLGVPHACVTVDADYGDGRRHVGWLIGQRPSRGQRGPRKYFWSNLGPQAALETLETMLEYAHRRHWIEQHYEEAKGESRTARRTGAGTAAPGDAR